MASAAHRWLIRSAKRATELAPHDESAWFVLGRAFYRAGRSQDALAALEKARQLDAGNQPATWFYLSLVYENLGERAKACQALNRAEAGLVGQQRNQRALGELREEARRAIINQEGSPADLAGPKARRQG